MTITIAKIITETQARLDSWFEDAQIDYGITGSAKASFENGAIVIEGIEDGEPFRWSQVHYSNDDVSVAGLCYYFDCWAES